MKISTLAAQAALGLVLLYGAAPLVHAQQRWVAIEPASQIPFISGGVGKDQQAFLRKAGKDFSLRLEFSERKDNEFIVGAEVVITDLQGNPVFVLPYAGPIVNVGLPDGQYRVTASYRGRSETQLVTLRGKAGQDLYFHWKGREPSPASNGRVDEDLEG